MQPTNLLEEAKSHFEHWRAMRTKRGKIPEYLWDKVRPLLDHYPLTAISHALRVNANQIRANVQIDAGINFVEAKINSSPLPKMPIISFSGDTQTCSIEFHRANGGVLKIGALPVASLPVIIAQFMV